MEENNVITIEFRMVDRWGNKFAQRSTFEMFEDFGEREIDELGKKFNNFLSQCGYVRNHDYMLMDDLTLEELEVVEDFLRELRGNKED